jgi:hypothetical protein
MNRLRQQGVFLAALAVGFAFGAAEQYILASGHVTRGTWGPTLSQLSAPWLVLPFLLGCSQVRPRRAAVLGLTVTLAGLAGYFTMMWSPVEGVPWSQFAATWPTLLASQWRNIVGGLFTGPLFGYLGQRWRTSRWWVSAAFVAGAFCLEPLARWVAGELWPPVFVWRAEVALGVTLALTFMFARPRLDRAAPQ